MAVAGVDFNSFQVDVVLLSEDDDTATHHVFPFGRKGMDAFDRARCIREAMPPRHWWTDQCLAAGIEDPRGAARNVDSVLYRVQGAILACIPTPLLVYPWKPQAWRSEIGLSTKGKESLGAFAVAHWPMQRVIGITQDAADAYCLAYATRQRVVVEAAA